MQYPDTLDLISRLVRSPSVSSVSPQWDQGNEAVIDLLAEWFSAASFRVEKLPVPNCKGKYNLIATRGEGSEGLVLSGHTDTVPYDEGKWNSDPFTVIERDQRLYGLGTADMKSFFALILTAIRDLDLDKLKQPLIILATADEESSMCGARSLANLGRRLGRQAVIGEPTSLVPIRMHKGISMESIRLVGRSGHSSNPALGNSALDGMYLVMGELMRWRSELQAKYRSPMFEVQVPTLNLGHIHGGDNPNRICAQCELHFDIRPLPGMNLDDLHEDLLKRLHAVLATTGLKMEHKALFGGVPPLETPAEADIVRIAEQFTGHPATAVAFATEGPYLQKTGMDTIIMGPGNIAQAHQPDEFLALDQIQPCIQLLQRLIQHFCF